RGSEEGAVPAGVWAGGLRAPPRDVLEPPGGRAARPLRALGERRRPAAAPGRARVSQVHEPRLLRPPGGVASPRLRRAARSHGSGAVSEAIVDVSRAQGLRDLTADVCVIGSGSAGATVAWELAARGLDVVVLEEGGDYTGRQLTQRDGRMYDQLYM